MRKAWWGLGLVAGLALYAVLMGMAFAQEARCPDPARDWVSIQEKNPMWKFVPLAEADAKTLVANYNALEPVSTHKPQTVWVAIIGNYVSIAFVDRGCVLAGENMGMGDFTILLTPKVKTLI
jgi:hypothetical protein